MIYRLTAENCREAAYKIAPQAVFIMAPKGAHIASAAMLYNSRGREPSTRL